MSNITALLEMLAASQAQDYIGESISQLEHALQAAYFAEQKQQPVDLILASLLHDIGHLLGQQGVQMDGFGAVSHEIIGAQYLAQLGFSSLTCLCVQEHVRAKKYLAACSASYLERLSPASIETLKHQGGIMSEAQCAAYRQQPHLNSILKVRLNDDDAKIVGLETPDLSYYQQMIQESVVI